MPIIVRLRLNEEIFNEINKDYILGRNPFPSNPIKYIDIGESIRYMAVVVGLTEDGHLDISYMQIKKDRDVNKAAYTKKNILVIDSGMTKLKRRTPGRIGDIYFHSGGDLLSSLTEYDDFYVSMTHLKHKNGSSILEDVNLENSDEMEIDKVVLSKVLFFTEILLQLKGRLFVFNKYNSETETYEQKDSLLYIAISDFNFEEKLAHVLSLPEYQRVRPIEFKNISIDASV